VGLRYFKYRGIGVSPTFSIATLESFEHGQDAHATLLKRLLFQIGGEGAVDAFEFAGDEFGHFRGAGF
jgi:hypothetical protein